MSILSDVRTLKNLCFPARGGASHADRLDRFYENQADDYDNFRKKLLPGRKHLLRSLRIPDNGIWVDFGGGTGWNLLYLGSRLRHLKKVYLVDLCTPLLRIAQRRKKKEGWKNVEIVHADAAKFELQSQAASTVTFSFSLSMMPQWRECLNGAYRLLRPGGQIGVVDFYVSGKEKTPGGVCHTWLARSFWKHWFQRDGICLSPDPLIHLYNRFSVVELVENKARLPYLPLARVPYYSFIGSKPQKRIQL